MQSKSKRISQEFRTGAASVLGETDSGLSTSQIIESTCKFAGKFGVRLKYSSVPRMGPNKRTILADNLGAFDDKQVFVVILGLCDHPYFQKHPNKDVDALKLQLISNYSDFASEFLSEELDVDIVTDTLLWLKDYPKAKEYFVSGLQKFNAGIFDRNTLDDMRFALEQFLRQLFSNSKPLEKQVPEVGTFVKLKGGSPQFTNMLVHLLACYKEYQNDASKHDDKFHEQEVAFIIEFTASFMKHLIRIN
jgi:hypothetical protein